MMHAKLLRQSGAERRGARRAGVAEGGLELNGCSVWVELQDATRLVRAVVTAVPRQSASTSAFTSDPKRTAQATLNQLNF